MRAQTHREDELNGLERGPKKIEGALRVQTRGQQIEWGQGSAGPDPQKKLGRWVMVFCSSAQTRRQQRSRR